MKTLTITFFLLISLEIFGQCQPTNGPINDAAIYSIVTKDSIILASTVCGSYVSSNNGNSWTYLNANCFRSATVFKDIIYLATDRFAGILKFYLDSGHWHETVVDYTSTSDLYSDAETFFAASYRS